jgi:predicted Zn-dependent protease
MTTKTYDDYEQATLLFGFRDYIGAARLLAALVDEGPADDGVRLLLARSYYHSAQLGRAESELRGLVERNPADGYAHLLLARTLERRSQAQEALPYRRLAAALGVTEDA